MNEAIHHLGNDSPSFHPVHTLIRAVGPPVLHHSKGRGPRGGGPASGCVPPSSGRPSIGPFPAQALAKPLGLAVGPGRVRRGVYVPQAQGAAGLGVRIGDVGRAVIAHHSPALDPLAVEPGDGTTEKADHRWLLLIRQHLDVRQPSGVFHREVVLVVPDAVGAALLTIAGDLIADFAKAGQGPDVDVDQVARSLPLVPLHRDFGLQEPQTPETQSAESPGDGGEGSLEVPSDIAEVEPLVAEIHGLLDPPERVEHLRSTGPASGRRRVGCSRSRRQAP